MNEENKKQHRKTNNSESPSPDIWRDLEKKKKRGQWEGEIDRVEIREQKLVGGAHFFVIENNRGRSVKCVSCPIPHGHLLESHRLHEYKLEKGVLYLNDEPLNTRAEVDMSPRVN